MEKINLTKSNLKKIVQWSSSKYNEYKKVEVIEEMLNKTDSGRNFKKRYGTGSYAESGHLGGWGYTLEIKDGRNFLILDPSGKKYELVKKQPKPSERVIVLNPITEYSNICKFCGAEDTLEGTYYAHRHYYTCLKCGKKASGGITKTEWKKRKLNYMCIECNRIHKYGTKIWEKHKQFKNKKMTSLERKELLQKQKSKKQVYKTF